MIAVDILILISAILAYPRRVISGQATEDWPLSPSVFLAMFAAVCNTSIHFALAQAAPLAWWYYASRGSTLHQLQAHWEASQGFFRACMNARHARLIAVATIGSVLVAVDGPLLQKASSVMSKTQTRPTTLQILLTPELPTGWSGVRDINGIQSSMAADMVLNEYLSNSTVTGSFSGCKGECLTAVRGPGVLAQKCNSTTWPITPEMLANSSATWGSGYSPRKIAPKPIFAVQIYDSALHPNFTGPEEVELLVGIANFTNCTGHYVEVTCTLVPAIMEYDITISGGNIVAQSTLEHSRIIAPANNSFVNSSDSVVPLTFTAIGAFLDPQVFANASLGPSNKNGDRAGNISVPMQDSFNVFAEDHAMHSQVCESQFSDPTADILARFNNIMFRGGLMAASSGADNLTKLIDPGLSVNQTVAANQTLTSNVFHSDLSWFAGAAVIELLAIIAVIPIFYGYWRLGIKVTLSPLEIAKAFGAPLLNPVNSATGSHGIVTRMGSTKVRYGAVADRNLELAEMDRSPSLCAPVSSRLAIAEWQRVLPPQEEMRFDR